MHDLVCMIGAMGVIGVSNRCDMSCVTGVCDMCVGVLCVTGV